MGNTLARMQGELSHADHAGARELLDRLEDMAQDRIDLFYDNIRHSDYDKHIIPIDKVLGKYTYITVREERDGSWLDNVKKAVGDFSVGAVTEGLSSIATSTIAGMLNSTAGRRQIQQRYAISLDPLGGVSRLDYLIFTYTFTSTELVKREASLIACSVVESSAAVRDLDANTLRVIVSHVFKGGDIPHSTLTAIYTQLVTAINRPTIEFSSLTAEEKEDLETWYKPGFKQTRLRQIGFQQTGFQPNGVHNSGEITYENGASVQAAD